MAEDGSETSSLSGSGEVGFKVKVRWVIPQILEHTTFIGKDILAVAHDIYIMFINFKNNVEKVYVANSPQLGDGVDAIAGYKSNLFAFAEKATGPRIFIMAYPSFNILATMKDDDVNRYKGLCMMECDLVAGLSGFPNYIVTVWSWRTGQKLISVPSGIVRRQQMFTASRMHMFACQCWGEGLIVWEVAQCFKKCLVMKRMKKPAVGWDVTDPALVGVCWANDGQLYGIDASASLYNVVSDGIGMLLVREWSEQLPNDHKPLICAFGNGLLIYGPDTFLRALKKVENKWKVAFTFTPNDSVAALVSNATCDYAAMWTEAGLLYKLTGEAEDKIEVTPVFYKQRFIKKIQMIAPDYVYLATMNSSGMLCIYEMNSGKLVLMQIVEGTDVSFETSPVEPIIAVFGCVEEKYGVTLYLLNNLKLKQVCRMCLTHQLVDRIVFSSTGREIMTAAMSAGHVFILQLSTNMKLTLVRYTELGRGLADCFLMKVGEVMRAFSLVLFSDKYLIGERVVCISADTGKDNKFAGKMQGPYARLLPMRTRDTVLAVPHLSRHYHVLKLTGEKGVTVSVKMGAIIDSGHEIKQFDMFFNMHWLLSSGFDGNVILRKPEADQVEYDLKLTVTHRYEQGIKQALIDDGSTCVHVASSHTCAVTSLRGNVQDVARDPLDLSLLGEGNLISCVTRGDKTHLELQEDKKVHEETMDYRVQRAEVVHGFKEVQKKVIELLEENIAERPLHQLSLSEFNLHLEHRKERKLAAEREREEIRLTTEALIRAQDKVTQWIKSHCWDSMLAPRVKLFAIFSHYQVENYPTVPWQRDKWPALEQTEALRRLEQEAEPDLLRAWEQPQLEPAPQHSAHQLDRGLSGVSVKELADGNPASQGSRLVDDEPPGQPYVLSGSSAHLYVQVPSVTIPQTLAFSFLQMNWLYNTVKLTVQNMRQWFNKQFDELMSLKKREVGLVEERNARLRFIIEELNKLSDLRGSFHHLVIDIKDPEWQQEEQPHRLIKVDPEECSIEPYISPSQIVLVPPDPGPKDDFRERALVDMMDGVLEKLWHEEIKKPIPMPQCMLDKDPEHYNEEDLRQVFDYEAKVAFRNEERDKYRKMLHAEYARLTQVLNEGVVKFNSKVKETWLLKLKVDSVNGQEFLNLMRLRRVNLDRLEADEQLETMRHLIATHSSEVEELNKELQLIQEQGTEVQNMYDTLTMKDKYMERTFKNHFADLSPIVVDQCYKFFRKRPKWQQRASMVPAVLYELAAGVLAGLRPAMLHPDCLDYFRAVDQLDQIGNMPGVMDEGLWTTMCKLRRAKIENEIRMRGVALEVGYVSSSLEAWSRALAARRARLAAAHDDIATHRDTVELLARNRTIQLVVPAGQVEIETTGHMADFEDAALIPRADIETINNLILKVGAMKLRMMRRQMDFRKGILAKEWEHAQMKMKLRHMKAELYSYERLKIPKELQLFLKNKELGYTEEYEFVRMEKEMEAAKLGLNKALTEQMHRVEDLQMKINAIQVSSNSLEALISSLHVKVSEKRINEDPLEPIRVRRVFKRRMCTLVARGALVREVQALHGAVVLLQTELELLRLKTYPTLARFRTYD